MASLVLPPTARAVEPNNLRVSRDSPEDSRPRCQVSAIQGRRLRVGQDGPQTVLQKRHCTVRRRTSGVRATADNVEAEAAQRQPLVKTAAESVNLGLELFKKGKVKDALRQFDQALEMKPSEEVAQAALYNKACCHAYREEGALAQAALREALGKYDLRFSVILADPDLAPFRAMPEFRELQEEARRGGAEVGGNFRRDLKLISETRAPFRGVRKFLYVALGAAAGISTVITLPRVIVALQGGEGAPDLLNTLGNLGINVAGGAVFLALFLWEQKNEEEQILKVSRDETLSRLPLRLFSGRIVELAQLRQTTRPVIVAGSKESVARALKKSEGYRNQLQERGVLIIPLVLQGETAAQLQAQQAKRKGFGAQAKAPRTGSMSGEETLEEFEERAREAAAKRVSEVERRSKAEPEAKGEWLQWVREQQDLEGVQPGDDVWILLRLDGRVRKSGIGQPDWADIITDTPALDSLISKLER